MTLKIYGGEDTPLIQCLNPLIDKWMVLWGKSLEDESFSFISEIFDHKPSLQEIKDVILNWYNNNISNKILSGFIWRDIPVWLSTENQSNYTASYTIAMQSESQELPIFKLGTSENPVYYKFESLEDLKDFYSKVNEYINKTLTKGWKIKDSIDWEMYKNLLDNYEEI